MSDFDKVADLFKLNTTTQATLIEEIRKGQESIPTRDLILQAVKRVTIDPSQILITIKVQELVRLIIEQLHIVMPEYSKDETAVLSEAYITRRAHKGALVLKSRNDVKYPFDMAPMELKNLVRGIVWRDRHFEGETLRHIARDEQLSESYVRKVIMQSFDRLIF